MSNSEFLYDMINSLWSTILIIHHIIFDVYYVITKECIMLSFEN